MHNLGIIEGYFGRCWSWDERAAVVDRLAPVGYRFFHYAPKLEAKLRRAWQIPFDRHELEELERFASHCRGKGVRFGVGLTPFGAHLSFDLEAKEALRNKLAQLDEIGLVDHALLFDDMDGDIPDLARRQAEIMAFVLDHSRAERHFMCPSYYSDDPVLDRVFGKRPEAYLGDLGRLIDRDVAVYWTGEEVCSREYSKGHLDDVADRLGRRPALWDNYPVNDGPRMSTHLHLRAFTGRHADLEHLVTHHAINPMSQPLLGCIAALTLPMAYREGPLYAYGKALKSAAETVCGSELADMILANHLTFNDSGLERLGDETKAKLLAKYGAVDHPVAREICDWLRGGFAITGEMLQTQ